jgi:transglutaminase-like putative cysteine protease
VRLSLVWNKSLHLRIRHRTLYRYPAPSTESHNEVRLEPVRDECQSCLRFEIRSEPPSKIFSFSEPGGNVHHFTLRSPHRTLTILAESEVETHCANPFEALNLIEPDLDFYEQPDARQTYAEYLAPSPFVAITEEAKQLAMQIKGQSEGVTALFLLGLNQYIFKHLAYDPDVTHVHSTVDEVFSLKAGVCQDFAHVMIACCRSVGIPARYVSGYLHSSRGSGIRGSEAMHAWVECPLPNGHNMALDPTNNLLANDHHVRVHTGRDYADITPLKGLYKGASEQKLEVHIEVDEVAGVRQGIA